MQAFGDRRLVASGLRRADQVRRDQKSNCSEHGPSRAAINQKAESSGRRRRRRDPPQLARAKLCRGHGRELWRKPKTWSEREHSETGKPPEHALAPVPDAAGKLARGDKYQGKAHTR